jgi:hypothetical protein
VIAVKVSRGTAAKKSARGSAQLPPATQQQATPNKKLSTTSSYMFETQTWPLAKEGSSLRKLTSTKSEELKSRTKNL